MRPSGDPFDRILAALQEAALNEAQWLGADRLIGEFTGTSGTVHGICGGSSQADATVFLIQAYLGGRRRKDWERKYFEDYYADDESIPRILRQQHGRITLTRDLFTDAEKKTSLVYNELLADTEALRSLNMRLEGQSGPPVLWHLLNHVERGGVRSDQLRLIRRLQPHVRQSVLVNHALAEARVEGAARMELLTCPRFGVIYLDRRSRIMTMNDRALDILRQGDNLMDDRDGFLCTQVPSENAELSRLLASALPLFGVQGSAGSMLVTRSPSSPIRLALHVTPVGEEYPHFRTRTLGAIVLIVDPAGRSRVDSAQVATILGLSPTESQLAVALAFGQTLQDFARQTGRAEETVRTHLKKIYRKRGISRQVDLVRQVLSLESFGAVSRHR